MNFDDLCLIFKQYIRSISFSLCYSYTDTDWQSLFTGDINLIFIFLSY